MPRNAKKPAAKAAPTSRRKKEPAPAEAASPPAAEPLSVYFKDFGPIVEGEIELKPLTILIGPNNSGKSYAAMAVHTVSKSLGFGPFMGGIHSSVDGADVIGSSFEVGGRAGREFRELVALAVRAARTSEDGTSELSIPRALALAIAERAVHGFLQELVGLLAASFGVRTVGDLTRSGVASPGFDLAIGSGIGTFSIDANFGERASAYLIKRLAETTSETQMKVTVDRGRIALRVSSARRDGEVSFSSRKAPPSGLASAFAGILVATWLLPLEGKAYYLPAARSGLGLLEPFVSSEIRRFASPIQPSARPIPRLPTAIWEHYVVLDIARGARPGSLADMAGDMERELADGHLATPDSTSTDPAFRYVMKSGEAIPLDRASSSILELVPLVMAVRSVLASGDQLIIEEPEAHLHPAKQRILAKYLVRLVRAGVRLLITTHSDYLLEQISNAVALGGLAEVDPRAKEGDYLRADEVAVHLFKPTKERGGGYMIDRVEVDQTEGIDMEEFNKVVDSLYDETYRLRTAIAKAKKTKK